MKSKGVPATARNSPVGMRAASTGSNVAQAAAVHMRLCGAAGDVTVWLRDAGGYASAPLPLRLHAYSVVGG